MAKALTSPVEQTHDMQVMIRRTLPLLLAQAVHDQSDSFSAIGKMVAASYDRIEEVIGRGNLKYVLFALLLALILLWIRRRH